MLRQPFDIRCLVFGVRNLKNIEHRTLNIEYRTPGHSLRFCCRRGRRQRPRTEYYKMNNPGFISFQKNFPGFFHRYRVEEKSIRNIQLSDLFQHQFPLLSRLLNSAEALNIHANDQPHILYTWNRTDGANCGWLCKVEEPRLDISFIPEHRILLSEMGGIQESYGSDEKDLALCQFFLFTGSRCEAGLGDLKIAYEDWCIQCGYTPLPTDHLITFVIEGNGNRTLYDPTTGKVLLYAFDHNFNFVTPVPDQPEPTFYTIHGADTFTEYVELLARQWLEFVKKEEG